jgi:hypothetical protein
MFEQVVQRGNEVIKNLSESSGSLFTRSFLDPKETLQIPRSFNLQILYRYFSIFDSLVIQAKKKFTKFPPFPSSQRKDPKQSTLETQKNTKFPRILKNH